MPSGPESFFLKFQSRYYLTAVRWLVGILVAAAFVTGIIALLAALYFGSKTSHAPAYIPPPSTGSSESSVLSDTQRRAILQQHLSGPTITGGSAGQTRFVLTDIRTDVPVHYVQVDTEVGLIAGVSGFEILGGSAQYLSIRRSDNTNNQGEIYLTDEGLNFLRGQYSADELAAPEEAPTKVVTWELRIAARDVYRRLSAPVERLIRIDISPTASSQAAPDGPSVPSTPDRPMSPLESAAYDLAYLVDPNRTLDFFDVRREALDVPNRCRATNNDRFVLHFRQAVEDARTMELSKNLIAPLLDGVCASWRIVNEERQRIDQRAREAQREFEAESRRAQNEAARLNAFGEARRGTSLMIALGALIALIALALPLALLALENHSAELRRLVTEFQRISRNGEADDDNHSNETDA